VYPADLALEYNDWYGRYVHGWWNAVVTKRDTHLPVRGEVFGLLLDANRFVWFADHTSPNATDDSMTGFTYMDSRTARWCTTPPPAASSTALRPSVRSVRTRSSLRAA